MVPLQFFLVFAAAIFSLGLYSLIANSSKIACLIGGQLCLGGACLTLAAAARYMPNQEALIFNLVISLYGAGQMAAAVFLLSGLAETTESKNSDH
ncbi:MAG: NADH-quinone oxidoreductase subunit K [Candidatus Bruticola sp.]